MINLESREKAAFSELDQRLVEAYAKHVASAMERLKQIAKLREIQEDHTVELIQGADRVTSMLRHDLRGPLGTIKNAAFMLQEGIGDTGEMTDIINRSVDYAIDMLEDLKNVTRQTDPVLIPVEVNDLIEQSVKEMIIPEEIAVSLHMGDVPPLLADKVKIRRVLDNLIRNAVEAMPEKGELTVTTSKHGDKAVIEVADTGEGICSEIRPRLFKPFVSSTVKGIGLGLTFCKQTLEAHGGTITVETEESKGTTFTVTLPIKE